MARALCFAIAALALLAPLAHAQDVLRVTDAGGATRLLLDDDEFSIPPFLRLARTFGGDNDLMTLERTQLRINSAGGGSSAPSYIALRIRANSPYQDVVRIDASGGLVAMGRLGEGIIPASGAGDRLMWHPYKAAFRAGSVGNTQWNEENVGFYSWAGGYNARAQGLGSLAFGYETEATGHYTTALGAHASTNSQQGALVLGDASTTTLVTASASNQLTARYAGGYRLFTSATLSTGAALGPGATSWTVLSDSTRKERFVAADPAAVLAGIAGLRLGTWNYKGQDPATARHWGPMAQDFFRAFGRDGVGTVGADTTISTQDADGVLFAAAQALEVRTRQQAGEIAALREALAAATERLTRLEAAVAGLAVPATLASRRE